MTEKKTWREKALEILEEHRNQPIGFSHILLHAHLEHEGFKITNSTYVRTFLRSVLTSDENSLQRVGVHKLKEGRAPSKAYAYPESGLPKSIYQELNNDQMFGAEFIDEIRSASPRPLQSKRPSTKQKVIDLVNNNKTQGFTINTTAEQLKSDQKSVRIYLGKGTFWKIGYTTKASLSGALHKQPVFMHEEGARKLGYTPRGKKDAWKTKKIPDRHLFTVKK